MNSTMIVLKFIQTIIYQLNMIIEIFNKEDIINNERDIKIIKVITNK
jgi:hypothetical protein